MWVKSFKKGVRFGNIVQVQIHKNFRTFAKSSKWVGTSFVQKHFKFSIFRVELCFKKPAVQNFGKKVKI